MRRKPMNKFIGRWRITEMELWDQEYVDLVEPGYFLFDDEDMGEFVFGTVSGFIDCRFNDEGDLSRVEYSWEGTSETDPVCGRGWFELRADDEIYGRLFIHAGDESWIKAKKE
jgi:hypothetical protein